MSLSVKQALENFVSSYLKGYEQSSQNLVIQYDPQWPSPCYQQQGEAGDWVDWLPVKQEKANDFTDLEDALGVELNSQLKDFFSSYWSENLSARTQRGGLELLLPWNQDDLIRLQQNLVGHVLMKRRLGQPVTFFFAVTDGDDFNLCVAADSGEVVLEQVGLEPQEVIAPDLATFIASLTPRID